MFPDSEAAVPWFNPAVATLPEAIAYALAYADVFNYPLLSAEVHRYLVGFSASVREVEDVLAAGLRWEAHDGYYTLPGRSELVALRERREAISVHLWPRAMRYGRLIARLPFVRMVALTGALTMGNVESGDDIDFLLVTEPGRLWMTRLFTIGLIVKTGGIFGDEVCPNYLLTTDALVLAERSLFTAHELAQMIPVYGFDVYKRMRCANAWADDFLPNAREAPETDHRVSGHRYRVVQWLTEPWLRTPVGTWLEEWERRRKTASLTASSDEQTETTFDGDQCKGHIGSHGSLAFSAFKQRIHRLQQVTDAL